MINLLDQLVTFKEGKHEEGGGYHVKLLFDPELLAKGRMEIPKRMFFRKSSKRGGGVISNPKIYIADFGPLNRAFSA